ncbi:hypothetical protein D3C73_640400 [compost metagenome]
MMHTRFIPEITYRNILVKKRQCGQIVDFGIFVIDGNTSRQQGFHQLILASMAFDRK